MIADIQCKCGFINRRYHLSWSRCLCQGCREEIKNPLNRRERCPDTGRFAPRLDSDTRNEIKRGAGMLSMDMQDAIDLFVVSPGNFREKVRQEYREWLKI